jgi:hypothetical protein
MIIYSLTAIVATAVALIGFRLSAAAILIAGVTLGCYL